MAKQRRYYSLAKLLNAQPRGLVKDPRHRLMWDHFMASERLQTLRINRRCYSLLNRARIRPENIRNFYRTYRLPSNPFFPLFLAIKRDWLISREELKEKRETAILAIVKSLPPERRRSMREIAEYEQKYNHNQEHPVWNRLIYPGTLKKAREMVLMSDSDWYRLWEKYFLSFAQRYPGVRDNHSRRLALMVLHCPAELPGNSSTSRSEIVRRFRQLSKQHHPDHGGEAEYFRLLKASRDLLINKN